MAVLAAPGVGYVGGISGTRDVATHLSDRIANGEAWPGERMVRLPRGYARHVARVLYGYGPRDSAEAQPEMIGLFLRQRSR
jgi:hypothetical protein